MSRETMTGRYNPPLKKRLVLGLLSLWYWTKIATGGSVIAVAAFVYGTGVMVNEAHAENIGWAAKKAVKEELVPVMQRIMDCESGARLPNGRAIPGSATHVNKNGQVIRTPNTNGTVDTGIAAINTVWDKKASELMLDLTKEEDNIKMALWIYANRGTGDWEASRSCWSK
jgi:hypothetical protein